MSQAWTLWGLAVVRPVAGLGLAFIGFAVFAGLAVLGQETGLPGLPAGIVGYLVLVVHAVVQPARLTFTEDGILRDRWLAGVRRREFHAWDEIETLHLLRGDDEPDGWYVRLRAVPPAPRGRGLQLLLAGDTREWSIAGRSRRRHLQRHARLLAAFEEHGVPLEDAADPHATPQPIGTTHYARFVRSEIEGPQEPPPVFR